MTPTQMFDVIDKQMEWIVQQKRINVAWHHINFNSGIDKPTTSSKSVRGGMTGK